MPENDELRAAAERVRRVKAGEAVGDVYDPARDNHSSYWWSCWDVDNETLTDAYLAHLPLTRERVEKAVRELFNQNGRPMRPVFYEHSMVDDLCRLLGVEGE